MKTIRLSIALTGALFFSLIGNSSIAQTAPVAETPPASPTGAAVAPKGASDATSLMKRSRENQKPMDRAQVESWLESVSRLIEQSSAAKQIEDSGVAAALQKREEARALLKAAKEALDRGDIVKPQEILPQASHKFVEAARLAAPEQITAGKQQTDFNARLESVKSLYGAYTRVASEKSAKQGVAETKRSIDKALTEAEQLGKSGKYVEGRAVLDKAYLLAKAALSSLRSGDTLVRTLNFASKEEEYHYELDRNDTHQMLIRVLLAEKRNAAEVDGMVRDFMDKAKALRSEAEAAAQRKDFAAAIKLLEDSTGELVRAIRNAGVFIPG